MSQLHGHGQWYTTNERKGDLRKAQDFHKDLSTASVAYDKLHQRTCTGAACAKLASFCQAGMRGRYSMAPMSFIVCTCSMEGRP